jgi:peptidoglycan/LPS O-acetylase OafA/YrhL
MGALRLFLAFVVVYGHLPAQDFSSTDPISKIFLLGLNGTTAVLLFYVISGFLISFALSNKYGTSSGGIAHFYAGRVIRIFSLYWPLLLLAALVSKNWILSAPIIDKFLSVTVIGMDWRFAFADYPNLHVVTMPVLGQAWTLSAELTFYLIAPFLLRS